MDIGIFMEKEGKWIFEMEMDVKINLSILAHRTVQESGVIGERKSGERVIGNC